MGGARSWPRAATTKARGKPKRRGSSRTIPILSDKLERLLQQQRSRAEGHQRYCDNTLDTAALDAELRAALAEEVFPEFVEIEFARERVCFAQKPIAATKKMAM